MKLSNLHFDLWHTCMLEILPPQPSEMMIIYTSLVNQEHHICSKILGSLVSGFIFYNPNHHTHFPQETEY